MGICIDWYKVGEAKRVLKNNRIMLGIENKTKERQTFPVEEECLDSKKKKKIQDNASSFVCFWRGSGIYLLKMAVF